METFRKDILKEILEKILKHSMKESKVGFIKVWQSLENFGRRCNGNN